MSSQLSIEAINAPFNVEKYRARANRDLAIGRTMLKVGVVTMVLNDSGEMLCLHHEAREGQWFQGALGPSMETARYTKQTEESARPESAESPMQAMQRSLQEELGMDQNDIVDAGFYFSQASAVFEEDWNCGRVNGYDDAYFAAINMIVHVREPDIIQRAFSRIGGRSEEVNRVSFVQPSAVLGVDNVRPGTHEWLRKVDSVRAALTTDTSPMMYVEPVVRPAFYGEDIRFAA